jgi:hypothetical protein
MKRFAVIAVAGIALGTLGSAVHAQTADTHPDFAGQWKMDTTKFVKSDKELVALTLDVTRAADTLIVATRGTDVGQPPFTFVTRYDPSSMTWQGDTLVLHTTRKLPQRTLDIEERWSVDGTGRMLSRTQNVRDITIDRLSRQTLLFVRVENPVRDYNRTRTSEGGLFRVTIRPDGDSVPMRKLQTWTIHIETPDSAAVDSATVDVDGGMPEHGHGLPTKAVVTRQSGRGDYVVEGIEFSMTGWWVVKFRIRAPMGTDLVVFNLKL